MDTHERSLVTAPHLCEPFSEGRNTARLLHDLGSMLALLNHDRLNLPILDFGAGSTWITEVIARMGQAVVAFDIHTDLGPCIDGRAAADARIDRSLIAYQQGDGHNMPFQEGQFGHILCYDTLHHMHDFDAVFREFNRVLAPGGRAIFVEPGAMHSTSAETVAFMEIKKHDPTWIERDIVLEEINRSATAAGFSDLAIMPAGHPNAPIIFSLEEWLHLRDGDPTARDTYAGRIAEINYNQRVIFFLQKD